MKVVVVNKCYGGFGVTVQVLKELVKLNSDAVESDTPKKYYGGESENYKSKDDWEKKWNEDFKRYKPIGDGFLGESNSDWLVYNGGLLYTLKDRYDNELRSNKDLISVIEQIGVDQASSSLAKLEIIDIPDGIEWEIDNYDGIETIHEKHRSW